MTLRAIDCNGHVPDSPAEDDPCVTMVERMAEAVADLFRLAAMFGVPPAELAAQAGQIMERDR